VEDIQIPAPNVPARIIHSDYDKLISNIVLDENELNNYVEKLVYKSGKNISAFRPLLSIRSSDTTRLTVTYKKEIGHKGSSITIRKFPENPWSITRLIVKNTLDPMMAAWLMQLIENKKAILIIGGMGCGKTSLINGLCNCINERATIITVEDTPELRLAHPYWIPLITRESLTLDEKGSIDMFTLVKHALRMSGDYLIVGEVRGEEGRIWAQAIMTGHGGITSFHAETHNVAVERLINEPINVDVGSLASLHSIVNIKKYVLIKEDERGVPRKVFVRRIAGIYDLEVQLERKKVKFYKMFSYDSIKDSFNVPKLETIVKLPTAKLIMEEKGWDEKMFINDLITKHKFFLKLKEKSLIDEKFLDYRFVTQLIWKFYENPKQFNLEEIKEEEKEGKEIEIEEEGVGVMGNV
jgi:flagellar protein FlaI